MAYVQSDARGYRGPVRREVHVRQTTTSLVSYCQLKHLGGT